MEQQAMKLESEWFSKLQQEYIRHYQKFIDNPDRTYDDTEDWVEEAAKNKAIEKLSFKLDKIWDKFKIDF